MKRPIESDYISQVAYTRALEAYCDGLAQPEQEPEFFTHNVEQPHDWSEWVCPDPKGYLMKCCDCGLVHEAEFGVVRFKSETEREDCKPVNDPNLQAVFRMRRSEQWSPEDTAHRAGGLTMAQPEQEPCKTCNGTGEIETGIGMMVCDECHGTIYTPPQRTWVGLTDEEIEKAWPFVFRAHELSNKAIYQAIEAKLKEKNQ